MEYLKKIDKYNTNYNIDGWSDTNTEKLAVLVSIHQKKHYEYITMIDKINYTYYEQSIEYDAYKELLNKYRSITIKDYEYELDKLESKYLLHEEEYKELEKKEERLIIKLNLLNKSCISVMVFLPQLCIE